MQSLIEIINTKLEEDIIKELVKDFLINMSIVKKLTLEYERYARYSKNFNQHNSTKQIRDKQYYLRQL